MAGWEIAVSIMAGWFAVSLAAATVIGKALRRLEVGSPSPTSADAALVSEHLAVDHLETTGSRAHSAAASGG